MSAETLTNHDEHCPYKAELDALRAKLAAAYDGKMDALTPTEKPHARG